MMLKIFTLFAYLSVSASALTQTIKDVKHVVIFMQENRPYDHYYGTLNGGRGFADRHAPFLPDGNPVWYQPVGKAQNGEAEYLLPFHLEFNRTAASCMAAPEMDFDTDIAMFNQVNCFFFSFVEVMILFPLIFDCSAPFCECF